MAVSIEELEDFHSFATAKLTSGSSNLEWQELFQLWQIEHPSETERHEVAAIIRHGDEDIANGRGRAADDFNEELRRKHKLSAE